jgi:hypothetical protein
LARLTGSLDPDGLMECITNEDFDKLEAYDKVLPLDHTQRMLGFIAYMLAEFFGLKFEGEETLMQICMPWMPKDAPLSSANAVASLSAMPRAAHNPILIGEDK